MNLAQVYCTTGELIDDLRMSGDEPKLLDRVREASRLILNRLGVFLPITDSRTFAPGLNGNLSVDPLLSVSSITQNGVAVTGYTLLPRNRRWLNGPYTEIQSPSGWSDQGVTVAGQFGKYDATQILNVSAITQLLGTTTLTVSDGSRISPGMVIEIEDEQQLVTAGAGGVDSPAPIAATSALDGEIGTDDEEITVDDGSEFNRGEVIQLSMEDCLIRRIAGNVLVVARGWNGTTKSIHADDLAIGIYRTFAVERGVNGTAPLAHATKPVSRYLVPEDINWLARQTAGLMRMKAAAGFASKTGNTELGETFYYSEFSPTFKRLWEDYHVR